MVASLGPREATALVQGLGAVGVSLDEGSKAGWLRSNPCVTVQCTLNSYSNNCLTGSNLDQPPQILRFQGSNLSLPSTHPVPAGHAVSDVSAEG